MGEAQFSGVGKNSYSSSSAFYKRKPGKEKIKAIIASLCLLLFAGEALAITWSMPTTSSNGSYTITWSGVSSSNAYQSSEFWLYEKTSSGTVTTILHDDDVSGTKTITKTGNGAWSYYFKVCTKYYNNGSVQYEYCGSTSEKSIVVTFPKPSITASFKKGSTSVTQINEGETATFSWAATNATSCSATGISGVSGTSGSVIYSAPAEPTSDITLTARITCTGAGGSTPLATTLTVKKVNDRPTISDIPNKTINEDGTTGKISFTVADVDSSSLSLSATSSNTALISVGNITFTRSGNSATVQATPAANKSGSAVIEVTVSDGALTASDKFTVIVNSVNDTPVVNFTNASGQSISSVSVSEDGSTNVYFTVTDPDSTPALAVSSDNTTLITVSPDNIKSSGSSRWLVLTPNKDQPKTNVSGTAHISLKATDEKGASHTDTVTLTVTQVNDAPTINAIAPRSINRNSGTEQITVSYSDFDSASLNVRAKSSNQSIVSDTGLTFDSSKTVLSVTPTRNMSGTTSITVYVSDGQYETSTSFNLTVSEGQPPKITLLSSASITIDEDGSDQIRFSVSDVDSTISLSNISAYSESPGLFSGSQLGVVQVGSEYRVSVVPLANQNGSSRIILTAKDELGLEAVKEIPLTINPINDPPQIVTIGSKAVTSGLSFTINEDGTLIVNIAVVDPDSTVSLSVIPEASKAQLVDAAGITLNGNQLTVKPKANANGSISLQVRATDAQQAYTTASFALVINAVNDAPTISALAPKTIAQNEMTGAIPFTIMDVDSNVVDVYGLSNDQRVVPNAAIVIGGSGNSRTVSVDPEDYKFGVVKITLVATDGVNETRSSFDLTITEPPAGDPVLLEYTYDALGRLTVAQTDSQTKTGYCYDIVGNRDVVTDGEGGADACANSGQFMGAPPSVTGLTGGTHTGAGIFLAWDLSYEATSYIISCKTAFYTQVSFEELTLRKSSGRLEYYGPSNTLGTKPVKCEVSACVFKDDGSRKCSAVETATIL